jgi:hypothetical protein
MKSLGKTIRMALLAVLSAPLLLTCGTFGAEPVEVMSVKGPFGSVAASGTWMERVPVVNNISDSPVTLRVEILGGQASGQTLYTRLLTLPPHSQRRTWIAYRPGELSKTPGSTPTGGQHKLENCQQDFQVFNPATGALLVKSSSLVQDITHKYVNLAVVCVGNDPGEFNYLSSLEGSPLGDVERVLAINDDLPDVWPGYSLADILLVTSLDMSRLRPTQLQAILDWTNRGGVLVVGGGEGLGQMLQSELALACGLQVTGSHEVAQLTVAAPGRLDPNKTTPYKLDPPRMMAEISPLDAQVIATADGLPLMTRKQFGHGWVFTLAVPVVAIADKDLHALWQSVGQARTSRQTVDDNMFFARGGAQGSPRLEPAGDILAGIKGRRPPSRWLPVGILAGLGMLVLLAGTALSFRKRGELVWVAALPASIAAAIAIWVMAIGSTQETQLTHVGVLSFLDGGSARLQEMFDYYNGDGTDTLAFSSGGDCGLIFQPPGTGDSSLASSEIRSGNPIALPDQTMHRNSERTFAVDTILPLGKLDCTLSFGPKGAVAQVRNSAGLAINDAVIYINGRTYRVGNIPANGDASFDVPPSAMLGNVTLSRVTQGNDISPLRWHADNAQPADQAQALGVPKFSGEFSGELVHSPTSRLRNTLLEWMIPPADALHPDRNPPTLVGFTTGNVLDPISGKADGSTAFPGHVDRRGWCIVLGKARFAPAAAGGKIVIPPGFCDVDYQTLTCQTCDPVGGVGMSGATDFLTLVRPPASAGAISDASMHIRMAISAQGYRVVVSGAGDKVLGQFDDPSGTLDIDAPLAGQFRRDDGAYVLSVSVQPTRGASTDTPAIWTIRNIDISLEGQVK